MQGRRFAQVALPLPVDHPFTYSVPDSLRDRVAIGMRALVPMQRRLVFSKNSTTGAQPSSANPRPAFFCTNFTPNPLS